MPEDSQWAHQKNSTLLIQKTQHRSPHPPLPTSTRILLLAMILSLSSILLPFLYTLSLPLPTLRALSTHFFDLITPNPAACFAFANLALLPLSSFVKEPNHAGRLLWPERFLNGISGLCKVYYVVCGGMGCATFSVAEGWRGIGGGGKGFWETVAGHMGGEGDQVRVCVVAHRKHGYTNEYPEC